MDERRMFFSVGVVVVAATIMTISLIIMLGEGFRPHYTIFIRFSRAPGVAVDTPVRKNGVLIGRVQSVELLDEGGVETTARIDSKYRLRTNEVCRISTASLLGDAVLDFVPSSGEGAARQPIQDGDYLSGVVANDPLQVLVDLQGQMSSAVQSIEQAGNQVTLLTDNLNTIVSTNESQFQRIVQKSELALDNFSSALGRVDELIADPELKGRLKKTLEDLPQIFAEARTLLADARNTLQNFDRMSQRAERNLANLENFTEPLGAHGPQMVQDFGRSVKNLDEVLSQAAAFSRDLTSSEGTLARLVRDPTLYDKLERTLDNIEDTSRRLRPILSDVRVFTDKIATDPRQLGVKGALDRRPSGVGLKSAVGQLR